MPSTADPWSPQHHPGQGPPPPAPWPPHPAGRGEHGPDSYPYQQEPPPWQPVPPRSPLYRSDEIAPPPKPPPPVQPESPHELAELTPDVRGAAMDRLVRANASHARLAAELRGTADALSAHALILFSVERLRYPFQLSAATRLDLEQEEGENLLLMLEEITAHARGKIDAAARRRQRWDPRTPLTGLTTTSETLTPQHRYIGLGISTLDRPEMSWSQARRSVQHGDGLTLPGHGFLFLHDNTAAHLSRAAMLGPSSGQHRIHVNRSMRGSFTATRDDNVNRDRSTDTELPHWRLLRELHEVLINA